MGVLRFLDEEGEAVDLDDSETATLLAITGDLDAATISACPTCRSRVLAGVALVDVLDESAPHSRAAELIEFAQEAPTLHLYVVDLVSACRHDRWRDPLFAEWLEMTEVEGPRLRP